MRHEFKYVFDDYNNTHMVFFGDFCILRTKHEALARKWLDRLNKILNEQ